MEYGPSRVLGLAWGLFYLPRNPPKRGFHEASSFFLIDSHATKPRGADFRPGCFPFGYKPIQCLSKVKAERHQQYHIICIKHETMRFPNQISSSQQLTTP
ncbi:hypothetical protein ILYODFUR_022595 [Ilyodon furcidens]|uniref:Uncharacterized protein n=1 Tax=Ilyodon furcidens TaxID=33524 RepID=A0ABV0U9B1_9TELE